MTPDQLQAFFAKASAYFRDPRFQAAEIDYKLRFQGELRPAMEAYRKAVSGALSELTAALRSPNQNTIDWRIVQPLLEWCQRRPGKTADTLRALWFGRAPLDARFRAFVGELARAGISQTGAQLSITSTLLMGISAREYPPIRTHRFSVAFTEAGYSPFERDQDAASRYAHALRFLDLLIERAPTYGLRLHHRLEAQGLVWCVGGGWEGFADSGNFILGSDDDELDDSEAARVVEAAAHGQELTETERKALVLSRRGQGQFRDELIGLWGKCAVTGCRDTRMLRASHLKPWKQSRNSERLDPFNGVLLAPHLDTALDRGLITFTDDGQIRLSATLSPPDCKCLGIRRAMKLSYVEQRHRPYLRFHREHVFRT